MTVEDDLSTRRAARFCIPARASLAGVLLAAFALLLAAGGATPGARAASSCDPVTRGTLAEVVAVPGFVVVADVVSFRVEGTPTVDTYAVREIIRPPSADRGTYIRDGRFVEVSNDCWRTLFPGDRVVLVFSSPDTLTPIRAVAWRIWPDDRVEQVSRQEVTQVPEGGTALIRELRRLVAGAPDLATDPTGAPGSVTGGADGADSAPSAAGDRWTELAVVVGLLAVGLAIALLAARAGAGRAAPDDPPEAGRGGRPPGDGPDRHGRGGAA